MYEDWCALWFWVCLLWLHPQQPLNDSAKQNLPPLLTPSIGTVMSQPSDGETRHSCGTGCVGVQLLQLMRVMR